MAPWKPKARKRVSGAEALKDIKRSAQRDINTFRNARAASQRPTTKASMGGGVSKVNRYRTTRDAAGHTIIEKIMSRSDAPKAKTMATSLLLLATIQVKDTEDWAAAVIEMLDSRDLDEVNFRSMDDVHLVREFARMRTTDVYLSCDSVEDARIIKQALTGTKIQGVILHPEYSSKRGVGSDELILDSE